jgi:hypothetical protein
MGETPEERLRDLLWNRQMPDDATLKVTLGELRAAFLADETLDVRTFLRLRNAARDVVIQEGRYYERDGSGESAVIAVVPKAALVDLRAALAHQEAGEEPT